jgi:hypothetical protein
MTKRDAERLAALAGFVIGMMAVAAQHRPADGRDLWTVIIAVLIPWSVVHYSGIKDV